MAFCVDGYLMAVLPVAEVDGLVGWPNLPFRAEVAMLGKLGPVFCKWDVAFHMTNVRQAPPPQPPELETQTAARVPRSLAFFGTRQAELGKSFSAAALSHLKPTTVIAVVRDDQVAAGMRRAFGKGIRFKWTTYDGVGLHRVPVNFSMVRDAIATLVANADELTLLVVDMSWGLDTNTATANFENWMALALEVAATSPLVVVSTYNQGLLIDEHLLAALHGHPEVLTEEGLHPNPHWLPPAVAQSTPREQVNYFLGQIAPSLRKSGSNPARYDAEGADPRWLLRPKDGQVWGSGRWKIRCLGRLRVLRTDGTQVEWGMAGGATQKIKTLFAYLLHQGAKGARADDLGDLLWADAENVAIARNRLHHAVRSLRRALANPDDPKADSHILRDGDSYVLLPPAHSWLDISSFEQLCRQSQSHLKSGDLDEALICLAAADRLYAGDLFEDIPAEYIDHGERDWCWTRRYWLRDMFLKVQRDATRIYRQRGELSSALAHCKKALAIDPLCEFGHEETMQIFAAQNRPDAIKRQFTLYISSLERFDDRPPSADLVSLYQSLIG